MDGVHRRLPENYQDHFNLPHTTTCALRPSTHAAVSESRSGSATSSPAQAGEYRFCVPPPETLTPPVRFQLAASNGLFPYPTRLRVKIWEDKLAAMLEQRTQEPLISRSRTRLFLRQNDNIGSFIGCFCQVFRQPATFSFFRTRPRLR